jgi:hypothetical protein
MKRLSFVLALAALVCLLAVSFVAYTAGGTSKKVVIQLKANVITVSPYSVRISKKAQDEVDWRCPDGDAEIRFSTADKGTPFVSGAFRVARGGGASSGPAYSDTGSYKYSIIVTVPGVDPNKQPAPLDPEVVVDP